MLASNPKIAPEERLGGGGAEADNQVRPDPLDFGLEPGPARLDLAAVRLLVDALLARACASAGPSPNTVCVARAHSSQARQPTASLLSSSTLRASSRAASRFWRSSGSAMTLSEQNAGQTARTLQVMAVRR